METFNGDLIMNEIRCPSCNASITGHAVKPVPVIVWNGELAVECRNCTYRIRVEIIGGCQVISNAVPPGIERKPENSSK